MRKTIVSLIITCIMPMNFLFGQTYSTLWKQVEEAQNSDLPQTELQVLKKIAQKAEKECAYGQLLKASLMQARVQTVVSPDSLKPAVELLQQKAETIKDVPLQAVYYAVLGKIYQSNSQLSDEWRSITDDYFQKAMSRPAELAAVKADGYKPFVVNGKDSEIYGDDLLSLIGHEINRYRPMHDYYMTTQNRRAQLMSGLYLLLQEDPDDDSKQSERNYIGRLDSLANAYADLPECGEVACERYSYMSDHTDATTEQKIAYIDEALSRWGSWQRMNELRNARRWLTSSQFHADLNHKVWIPNREQGLRLWDLRSVDQVTIKIYKVKVDGDTNLNPDNEKDYKKLKPLLTLLPELTQTRSFSGKKEYEFYEDSLQMGGLPVGVYMMEVESRPKTDVSRSLFFISDVRVLVQALPNNHDNQIRYVAVNATTGRPIAGAKIRLMRRWGYDGKEKVLATLNTDSKGEAVYQCKNQERPNNVFVTTESDRACPELNAYSGFSYYENQRTHNEVVIYTDRAIYRPGQTVNVAAILYKVDNGFEHEVRAGEQVNAELRDANYKVVEEKQLVTDEYGTVSTQFTLPTTALTGRFSIHVDKVSQYIRVEEYKRPTFQVEFPKMEQDYKDGDTLTVKATARSYSGVPVQGARVKYKVERRMAYWWMSYYRYWQGGFIGTGQQSEEVFSGEAMTADDGTFEVQMPMILPKSKYPLFYNFVVIADVTDLAGETHQGQLSLPLGNRKTALTADLPEKVLAEEMPQLKLHVLNAAGNNVSTTVRYQIDGGKWQSVQSNTSVVLPKLKSGKHELKAEYEGETLERSFVVFSLDDKRPATETDDWFYVSDSQFPNDGKPVTLQVGSSDDVHIVYTLVAGNTIVEQGAVDKKNELVNRKLTYLPEYGNGLSLSFAWVRNGKTYHHETQIKRPLPDKTLKMRWETFRDRLTPGQQEEWTLVIENPQTSARPNGTLSSERNLKPQLLATLYDKSLDQMVAHNWELQPYTWLPMASLRWTYGDWGATSCEGFQRENSLTVKELVFSRFDPDCFPYYWMGRRSVRVRGNGPMLMAKSASVNAMEDTALAEVAVGAQKARMSDAAIGAFDVKGNDEEGLESIATGRSDDASATEVQMRENLQETAFFYPQLLADSTGRVSLKFTLPESLTTWRFMGIAHTKDMMHGYIDGEAVAQKDVMIQPNVPRFLRAGDQGTISARIFNMTEQVKNGTTRLQLLDPETEEVLYDEQQPCQLEANGTSAVMFHVPCSKFNGKTLLVCKMMVSGETFSDGEQHYLPILPDREHVTVTIPFTQNEPGTKTFDLTRLFPQDKPQTSNLKSQTSKLTIEYTNNPAWLMIQALPTIAHPHDNCAVCQAASLYANTLGKYILDQNPTAKHVFEMWKRESGHETSMMSQLEKDQELKELLLNETPWVMDADCESEQKQRLADFFDENLMQQRLESALDNVKKLQRADGSWSWWEDMPGSFYMTVSISEMMVRLNQMTGTKDDTQSLLDKAFKFMNKEILELVAEMKKQEKKGIKQTFPTFKALQYLYLSALDGRKQPANVQQAQAYLKNLLKKDVKSQTIYEKAMAAIVLNSPLYIKSLKEYTVYKEEMGRYYDTPRAGYSWRDYRIPTQVAAIEAIQRLTPNDTKTIEEMQRWLLQEKRTQAWDTPLNSIDAIYAFLLEKGTVKSGKLATTVPTALSIDDNPLDTSDATAGIGYVKTSQTYTGQKTFTAKKTSEGTSWGAVYAQFMQPVADIKAQNSGISVKREILGAEANSTPYTLNSKLKVGSRIKVRITIEADRDYDFVQVIDKRAACLEPVNQLSGYRRGYYCSPKDNATNYYFDMLSKGKHVIETEYYVDREGDYGTGTCTVQCAYAPEFRGLAPGVTLHCVK